MTRAFLATVILALMVAAAAILFIHHRNGATMRPMYLVGMAGLAGGVGFWWFYPGQANDGGEVELTLSVVLAVIAVVAAASGRWGGRLLLGSAVLAPLGFVAYTASLYAFGDGVPDYPVSTSALLSFLVSAVYALPALVLSMLIHAGSRPELMAGHAPAPAGWYQDAGDLTSQRYWDGTSWTDRTSPGAEHHGVGT